MKNGGIKVFVVYFHKEARKTEKLKLLPAC